MRSLVVTLLFVCSLVANESEKMFWDEVKDTNDIEMLKLYKKRYPNGIFETLADLKIKRLKKVDDGKDEETGEPLWIKEETTKYKFYGVAKANTHYRGSDYQEKLAQRRATSNLIDKLLEENLSKDRIDELLSLSEKKKYVDESGKIYIMIYVDNDSL